MNTGVTIRDYPSAGKKTPIRAFCKTSCNSCDEEEDDEQTNAGGNSDCKDVINNCRSFVRYCNNPVSTVFIATCVYVSEVNITFCVFDNDILPL